MIGRSRSSSRNLVKTRPVGPFQSSGYLPSSSHFRFSNSGAAARASLDRLRAVPVSATEFTATSPRLDVGTAVCNSLTFQPLQLFPPQRAVKEGIEFAGAMRNG